MSSSKIYDYHQSESEPSRRQFRFFKNFLLVMVLAGGILLTKHFTQSKQADASNGVNKVLSARTSKPILSDAQVATMGASINKITQNYNDMDVGVSVEDLNNDRQYNYGEQLPFVAASVSKVLTASLFLHDVEHGKYSLSQDIDGTNAKTLLQTMIVNSDNDAWLDFNDLMSHPALASYAASIGLSNYDPDQNTLTVRDISLLLTKLYKRELINNAHTQLLLGYMKQANETDYIVASVSPGVTVYHKAGWLDDRVHDAAIIDNGKHPYVLVIFSKTLNGSAYPAGEGQQMYAEITKTTLQYFVNG